MAIDGAVAKDGAFASFFADTLDVGLVDLGAFARARRLTIHGTILDGIVRTVARGLCA